MLFLNFILKLPCQIIFNKPDNVNSYLSSIREHSSPIELDLLTSPVHKNFYLNEKVNFIKLPVKNNSFFGYYNISPFNNNGGLLWCETSENKTRGSRYSSVNIIYYNVLSDNKQVVVKYLLPTELPLKH